MIACPTCRRYTSQANMAQADLVKVSGMAARNPSTRNINRVNTVKAERDSRRAQLAEHERECEVVA